jgi:hypothetical protein
MLECFSWAILCRHWNRAINVAFFTRLPFLGFSIN